MKNIILGIFILSILSLTAQASWYDMDYKPVFEKYVLTIERTENGKSITESPASKSWIESFVNEQIKKGWKVSFDMVFEEQSADGFIVLTKGVQSIAMFNCGMKAYIITQHQKLASESDYLKVFYAPWFGQKALSPEQVKQKLKAKGVVPLYKETIMKIFS